MNVSIERKVIPLIFTYYVFDKRLPPSAYQNKIFIGSLQGRSTLACFGWCPSQLVSDPQSVDIGAAQMLP